MAQQQAGNAMVMNEMVICPDGELFSADVLRFFNCRVSCIAFLLLHPRAQKLEFNSCTWDNTGSRQPNRSQVRRIDLIDTSIDDRGFESILTGFSQLTELVYFRPTDETETDFDMIGGVLKEYGQRLEHLQMHNVSLMPFYTPVGSLHTCTSLKTLNMDLELLVGFHENPRGGHNEYLDASIEEDEEPLIYDEIYDEVVDWSLVKLLPTSLVKLTLWVEEPKIDAYYNTYERYGAKFEELLTSDDHSQNLQSVTASFLEPVAEKLRGTLTGWVMDGSTMVRMPTANMAVVASGVTDVEPITDDEEGS